ncbi:mitotic checkpoint regulator, MAD2B-interacting-domain-containing protein [Lipomyces chichibuensis]|uniref:mitotic checkpoint regulator, MAD2B-interacting-domain-containing protein n=1 Tax=Lipomyces chichibuensis TaxID=1546026 RepID=UPI003343272E
MSSPVKPDKPISSNGTVKRTAIQPFFAVKQRAKTASKSGRISDSDSRNQNEPSTSHSKDKSLLIDANTDLKRWEKRSNTDDATENDPADTIPMKKRKSRLAGMSLDLGLVDESDSKPDKSSVANFSGPYKPLMLPDLSELDAETVIEAEQAFNGQVADTSSWPVEIASNDPAQNLKTIAKEIGLSDSNLQILEGRHRKSDQPIRIVDYSVDEQYSYNQSLIASGAAQTVQPLRSIGSGKHQLRGLISSATQQREGLEEAFASGRRNKRESGAKYGF